MSDRTINGLYSLNIRMLGSTVNISWKQHSIETNKIMFPYFCFIALLKANNNTAYVKDDFCFVYS